MFLEGRRIEVLAAYHIFSLMDVSIPVCIINQYIQRREESQTSMPGKCSLTYRMGTLSEVMEAQ